MSVPLSSLAPLQLLHAHVWEYDNRREDGIFVRPVPQLPVRFLDQRFVATELQLANGACTIGLLSSLSLAAPELNEHFIAISIYGPRAQVFHLARYHDPDAVTSGPNALAQFLGLELRSVFPIAYDVSAFVLGPSLVTRGSIALEPSRRLSRQEVIALSVP